MLGVVSERFPKGGALTLGAIGAAGVFSGGLLGTTGIGYVQDYYSAARLNQEAPALYQQYAAADKKAFLFFPPTTGLDGMKTGTVLAKPAADLTAPDQTVRSAVIYGGRMSLKWTALVPAFMAVGYLLLDPPLRERAAATSKSTSKALAEAAKRRTDSAPVRIPAADVRRLILPANGLISQGSVRALLTSAATRRAIPFRQARRAVLLWLRLRRAVDAASIAADRAPSPARRLANAVKVIPGPKENPPVRNRRRRVTKFFRSFTATDSNFSGVARKTVVTPLSFVA